MENNKYFYPDIEDIHSGYECELIDIEKGKWFKYIVKSNENLSNFIDDMSLKDTIEINHIRVPYLTEEQIEAEGWKVDSVYPSGTFVMQLGNKTKGLECIFTPGKTIIFIARIWEVYPDDFKHKLIFEGDCKDINTFRKIIKLLN